MRQILSTFKRWLIPNARRTYNYASQHWDMGLPGQQKAMTIVEMLRDERKRRSLANIATSSATMLTAITIIGADFFNNTSQLHW